jgi:myo-inositol-1(or 4)-monophosphatase
VTDPPSADAVVPGDLPADLLALALRAAEAAAATLTGAGAAAELVVSTKSTPTDPVTQMDRAAERVIAATIRAVRPDDAFVGEEGQADRAAEAAQDGARVRWIVDPIDGTVNFLYGIPQWGISIAAEVGGVVVAGVVADAVKGETFTAIRGRGAFRNGTPIAASHCGDLAQALVGIGFGYAAGRRAAQARVLLEIVPLVRDVRRMGAASLDLCAVACGRLDAYYERGLNLWDHAAAGLIAAEAGARVEGLFGAPPSAELLVAAPPAIFPALHDLLVKHDAATD